MADLRKILATIGKVAVPTALNVLLPGSGGIIQLVEGLLGPGTGNEKKKLAVSMAQQILETLGKAGKLEGAAPAAAEIETFIQQAVDAMKKAGTLEETGVLTVGGNRYSVVVLGKIE